MLDLSRPLLQQTHYSLLITENGHLIKDFGWTKRDAKNV